MLHALLSGQASEYTRSTMPGHGTSCQILRCKIIPRLRSVEKARPHTVKNLPSIHDQIVRENKLHIIKLTQQKKFTHYVFKQAVAVQRNRINEICRLHMASQCHATARTFTEKYRGEDVAMYFIVV